MGHTPPFGRPRQSEAGPASGQLAGGRCGAAVRRPGLHRFRGLDGAPRTWGSALRRVLRPAHEAPSSRDYRSDFCPLGRPIHRRQISQTVLGHGSSLEPSSRSRGLLYVAAAVYAAAAHGARTVLVPENAQLAVNLPLSPSRAGACSTRSVHPRTLSLLNNLIAQAGR